jgi:antitoxin CptB
LTPQPFSGRRETQQKLVAAKRIKTSCYAAARAGAIGTLQSMKLRVAAGPGGVKRASELSQQKRRGRLMIGDLDVRRRRAAYRAAHRGTKEMDALIGRYADAKLTSWNGDTLVQFERLLAVADPTLQAWIFGNEECSGSEFGPLIADIRSFHGLDAISRTTG